MNKEEQIKIKKALKKLEDRAKKARLKKNIEAKIEKKIKTKLNVNNIPKLVPKKPSKLGLITTVNKKCITMRWSNETLERIDRILNRCKTDISHKICRTDIVEACIFYFDKSSNKKELQKIMKEYSEQQKK